MGISVTFMDKPAMVNIIKTTEFNETIKIIFLKFNLLCLNMIGSHPSYLRNLQV